MNLKKVFSKPQVFPDNSSGHFVVMKADNNTPGNFFKEVNKAIKKGELPSFDHPIAYKEAFIEEVEELWIHCHISKTKDRFDKDSEWCSQPSIRVFVYE